MMRQGDKKRTVICSLFSPLREMNRHKTGGRKKTEEKIFGKSFHLLRQIRMKVNSLKNNNRLNIVSYFSRIHYQFTDMLLYSFHRTFHSQASQESHIPPSPPADRGLSSPLLSCTPSQDLRCNRQTIMPDTCFCSSHQSFPFATILQGERGQSLLSLSSQKGHAA